MMSWKFFRLNRAWKGYFHNTTDRGAIFAPPPQNSGTTGPIYKIQTAFDRYGKFVTENLILLTLGSTMTSQIRSKSKCSLRSFKVIHWIFHTPFIKAKYPGANGKGKILCLERVIRCQRKVKLKNLCLGLVIRVFWSVFVKNAKNDPRTLFERPKSDNSWKCGNPGKRREKWPFSTFKRP